MAVLQRVRLISNERVDLPDALNWDAFNNADWSQFVDHFLTGAGSPLIIAGFDIPNPDTYVTKKSATILVNIANAMMFHPESTGGAGGFFVAGGSEPQQSIALTPGQTNFIELDQTSSTSGNDTRAIWDEAGGADGTGEEFKETIDTVTNLGVVATVNTVGFTVGKVSVAKVVVDVNGVITSITDSRNLMFRLGTGGLAPDPNASWGWPQGRADRAVTLTTADPTLNPFQGSDKAIATLKQWMNAVMTEIGAMKGPGAHWFDSSVTGGGSLSELFQDSVGSILTSKTGVGEFQWNGAGNTLTWNDDLYVQGISGPYFFVIKAGNVTLNAGDVAVASVGATPGQIRDSRFPVANDGLSWTNGATFVNGSNSGGSFAGLESNTTSASSAGDWIRKEIDTPNRYVRIKNFYNASGGAAGGGALTTAALAISVELDQAYQGVTDIAKIGNYAKGAYSITQVAANNLAWSTNQWWLASRWGTPTAQLYVRDTKLMQDGEHRVVGYAIPDAVKTGTYTPAATGALAATDWSGEVSGTDGYAARIGKLTSLAADSSQDKNIVLVNKTPGTLSANFTWSGTNLLWEQLYLSETGDDELRNKIADQTSNSGGLTDLADGDCLYVTINRTAGANNTLAVTKAAISSLNPATLVDQVFVFARRIGAIIYTRNITNQTNDIACHNVSPTNQLLFTGGHFVDDNRADLYYRALNTQRGYIATVASTSTTSSIIATPVVLSTIVVTVPAGFTADIILNSSVAWYASVASKIAQFEYRRGGASLGSLSGQDDVARADTSSANFKTTPIAGADIGVAAGTYTYTLVMGSADGVTTVTSNPQGLGGTTLQMNLRIP